MLTRGHLNYAPKKFIAWVPGQRCKPSWLVRRTQRAGDGWPEVLCKVGKGFDSQPVEKRNISPTRTYEGMVSQEKGLSAKRLSQINRVDKLMKWSIIRKNLASVGVLY